MWQRGAEAAGLTVWGSSERWDPRPTRAKLWVTPGEDLCGTTPEQRPRGELSEVALRRLEAPSSCWASENGRSASSGKGQMASDSSSPEGRTTS